MTTETKLVCNVCGQESGGYEGDYCLCGEGVLVEQEYEGE